MKQDGKGMKEIHEKIVDKYSSYGEGTPTPVPSN
ncbi:hypothetical protein D1B31_12995 [Neobacillus notoginsengisoli]|uniref:Uncharacterized protein n=3 Tax=Neobacillus notoginsengisoli TaxID=1578198 RepID=A0A417YSB7_9BACI|nr:hypothetical protein D1B31_12995 [Neobacillus notoginsengisoli]